MNLSEEELNQGMDALQKMSASLIQDKNRIAKAAAVFLRNQLEDFHVDHLSDEQMKSLNPLIRGAIYSFLVDYGDNYVEIDSETNIYKCCGYILNLTLDFLHNEGLTDIDIEEFCNTIAENIGTPLHDLARGGGMLAGYEWLYVPKYWEDCKYYLINVGSARIK